MADETDPVIFPVCGSDLCDECEGYGGFLECPALPHLKKEPTP